VSDSFYRGSKRQIESQHINTKPKKFILQIAYPDLRDALLRRGWEEEHDKSSLTFDLKFTLSWQDILYHALQPGQIVNHNRGSNNLTCKSKLISSLHESPTFWLSWLTPARQQKTPLSIEGISKGVDAFCPKSFELTSGKEFAEFQQYYWLVFCVSYIRRFAEEDAKVMREKLLICLGVVLRTLRDKDEQVDKEGYSGYCVSNEEANFLGKEVFPDSYLKFVHKEDWFIQS